MKTKELKELRKFGKAILNLNKKFLTQKRTIKILPPKELKECVVCKDAPEGYKHHHCPDLDCPKRSHYKKSEKPKICKNCNGKGYNSTIGENMRDNKISIVKIPCSRCVPLAPQSEIKDWDNEILEILLPLCTNKHHVCNTARWAKTYDKINKLFQLQSSLKQKIRERIKEMPALGYCNEDCGGAETFQNDVLEEIEK